MRLWDLVDLVALIVACPLVAWFITGCVFFPIRLYSHISRR